MKRSHKISLQTQNTHQILDFFVGCTLFFTHIAYVQQLSLLLTLSHITYSQREHAEVVAAHHTQTADCQRLGGVSLGDDEGGVHGVFGSSVVCIIQLGDVQQLRLIHTLRLNATRLHSTTLLQELRISNAHAASHQVQQAAALQLGKERR